MLLVLFDRVPATGSHRNAVNADLDLEFRARIRRPHKGARNRGDGFRVAVYRHGDVVAADYQAAGGIKPPPAGTRQKNFRPGMSGGMSLGHGLVQHVTADEAAGQTAMTTDLDEQGGEIPAGTSAC